MGYLFPIGLSFMESLSLSLFDFSKIKAFLGALNHLILSEPRIVADTDCVRMSDGLSNGCEYKVGANAEENSQSGRQKESLDFASIDRNGREANFQESNDCHNHKNHPCDETAHGREEAECIAPLHKVRLCKSHSCNKKCNRKCQVSAKFQCASNDVSLLHCLPCERKFSLRVDHELLAGKIVVRGIP